MDDRQFDALAKRLGGSRRSLLKKMFGLGGAGAVAWLGTGKADAARRGYAGPDESGLSSSGPIRLCWPFEPRCCIECSIAVSYAGDVRNRFEGCMMSDQTCDYCASHAVLNYQGTCRVL